MQGERSEIRKFILGLHRCSAPVWKLIGSSSEVGHVLVIAFDVLTLEGVYVLDAISLTTNAYAYSAIFLRPPLLGCHGRPQAFDSDKES